MRFDSKKKFGKNLNKSFENRCERGLLWKKNYEEWGYERKEIVWDGKTQVKLETCVVGCVNKPTSTTYTHNICAKCYTCIIIILCNILKEC
jgi:hypothetical protein